MCQVVAPSYSFCPPFLRLSPLPVLLAPAAQGGMVMFNACGLCCTQLRRMGFSPLISNKRSLETRRAQRRSTSSEVWSDVDTDVCPGPSSVSSRASRHLLTDSKCQLQRVHAHLHSVSRWLCLTLVDSLYCIHDSCIGLISGSLNVFIHPAAPGPEAGKHLAVLTLLQMSDVLLCF